jgi:hypothetical protein
MKIDRRTFIGALGPLTGLLAGSTGQSHDQPPTRSKSPGSHTIRVAGAGLKVTTAGIQQPGANGPDGASFRANNFYLELNGKPFPMVGASFNRSDIRPSSGKRESAK